MRGLGGLIVSFAKAALPPIALTILLSTGILSTLRARALAASAPNLLLSSPSEGSLISLRLPFSVNLEVTSRGLADGTPLSGTFNAPFPPTRPRPATFPARPSPAALSPRPARPYIACSAFPTVANGDIPALATVAALPNAPPLAAIDANLPAVPNAAPGAKNGKLSTIPLVGLNCAPQGVVHVGSCQSSYSFSALCSHGIPSVPGTDGVNGSVTKAPNALKGFSHTCPKVSPCSSFQGVNFCHRFLGFGGLNCSLAYGVPNLFSGLRLCLHNQICSAGVTTCHSKNCIPDSVLLSSSRKATPLTARWGF